jgi:hypothetical protein
VFIGLCLGLMCAYIDRGGLIGRCVDRGGLIGVYIVATARVNLSSPLGGSTSLRKDRHGPRSACSSPLPSSAYTCVTAQYVLWWLVDISQFNPPNIYHNITLSWLLSQYNLQTEKQPPLIKVCPLHVSYTSVTRALLGCFIRTLTISSPRRGCAPTQHPG